MIFLLNHPVLFFLTVFLLIWFSFRLGIYFRARRPGRQPLDANDLNLILGATLTLLGLVIGFTFSMAVGRYDQRKNLEEEEANAIGTEYVRLDFLPPADAAKARSLLRDYLDQRILYYSTRNPQRLRQIATRTAQLQSNLWSAVSAPAGVKGDPVSALVLSGMNDVLNSQGYTEAAWRNRVPLAAWALLIAIAVFCNLLLGYHAHGKSTLLSFVLPIALSISFFLIADIDSPRSGIIHIQAQNLTSLADSLRPH